MFYVFGKKFFKDKKKNDEVRECVKKNANFVVSEKTPNVT